MEFLRLLEQARFPAADVFFQFCTFLGQDIPVLLLICAIYWCFHKRTAQQIALSFFLSGILLQNLKITCRIERPWVLDPSFKPVLSAVPAATGYSFPSGHTQTAASLFSTLALRAKKRQFRIFCVCLFLLVGFSRMYLGVHTPADVGAALLIACTVSYVLHLFLKKNRFCRLSCFPLVCGAFFTLIYAGFLVQRGVLDPFLSKDCFKLGASALGFAAGCRFEQRFVRFRKPRSVIKGISRFSFGVLSALFLKFGLKVLLGRSIPAEILQYFLLLLWMTGIYPWLFSFDLRQFRHAKLFP